MRCGRFGCSTSRLLSTSRLSLIDLNADSASSD